MTLDQSLVRMIGRGLARSDSMVSGRLMDGSSLQNAVIQGADAEMVLYEGLNQRRSYGVPFAEDTNIAVLGTTGPEVAMDLRSGSQVQGELLIGEDGRVNMMGGTVDGEITILNGGRICVFTAPTFGHPVLFPKTDFISIGSTERIWMATALTWKS
ncbi:MAG: hypothetical protein R3C28_12260 [Pirellulaceae bacterium]